MKYSLYIGRWQPFHKGHKALIDVALKEGKNVAIAIRDTEKDEQNPYSYQDRYDMIVKEFKSEMKDKRVKIFKICDIEEICYGRKVGYGIREIKLVPELEEVSGTKIRNEMAKE